MRATVVPPVGIVLLAVSCFTPATLNAQEKELRPLSFWDTDRGLSIAAAIAVAQPGGPNPLGALGVRVGVDSPLVPLTNEWHFVFEKALPLDQRYLDAIKDGRPLPDVRARELTELKGSDAGIYLALNQALRRADQATEEMFERSAADNKHIIYADLNQQSPDHRGKVISIKGKLVVIRRVHAPRFVKDDMEFVYTAYIQGPTKGSPPYTVVFTELPPELDVGEEQHAVVTMHGYYLGLIRFQADKENRDRQKDVISPYLVGKTLVVNSKGPEKVVPEESHSYVLIVTVLTLFVLMAAFGALALMWLKRGDRKIQSKLAEVREKHTPFSLEPGDDPAAPPNPDGGFKNEPNPPRW